MFPRLTEAFNLWLEESGVLDVMRRENEKNYGHQGVSSMPGRPFLTGLSPFYGNYEAQLSREIAKRVKRL